MEFALGVLAGFLLWPWWAMGIFFLMVLVDAVLVENENATWGTFMMLIGTGLLVWLAGDANPFILVWDNLSSVFLFFIAYFVVGALWSVIKWYLYLTKIRNNMQKHGETKRPRDSYASQNQSRIAGWIGHWPFSMIGSLFGDFLGRLLDSIYTFLSSMYEKIGNSVFKDFETDDRR